MSNHNPNKKAASSEDRRAAIAAIAAKSKGQPQPGSRQEKREQATLSGVVRPSKPDRPTKIPADKNLVGGAPKPDAEARKGADAELDKAVAPKPKKERDANVLTVGDVARDIGVDPKRARARLRALGEGAVEGRWPKVRRDSDEHRALIAKIKPDDDKPADAAAEKPPAEKG